MSGADLAAYNRSVGVILNTPRSSDDAKALAEQLLDERDQEHKRSYGHYPGKHPQCTQPDRDAYRDAAEAAVAGPWHSVIPDGATTAEAQAIINRQAPWWYPGDPHGDPVVEQSRRELAAQIAALQVTR